MIQVEGIFSGGGSDISAPIIGKDFNWTGGDGTYQVLEDGGGNWRIKFLSSGTFTPLRDMVIDVFLVGGGGGKAKNYSGSGGAGYTTTVRSIALAANTTYEITVGAAGSNSFTGNGISGGTTSAFSAIAAGGNGSALGSSSTKKPGGDGGSGGAGYSSRGSALGGTDGSDGEAGSSAGGKGQGTTTREFGETDGDLYASGGGGNLTATVPNSGNGGAEDIPPAEGIVIIRKHKEAAA